MAGREDLNDWPPTYGAGALLRNERGERAMEWRWLWPKIFRNACHKVNRLQIHFACSLSLSKDSKVLSVIKKSTFKITNVNKKETA